MPALLYTLPLGVIATKMKANQFYNHSILRIGLIIGLIGGGLMIYLDNVNFGLGYFHGYLYIINYLLTMIISLTIYKLIAKESTTYLKGLTTGLLTYFLTTLSFIIYKIVTGRYSAQSTFIDFLLIALIIIGFGLITSSLLAFCVKSRQLWK